jgi:carboxyl-terminal processing protease
VLGWQAGVRFEQGKMEELREHLEEVQVGVLGSGATIDDPEQEVDIALLWHVWRLLLRHYIAGDALQARELLYGAIAGLVNAVGDPYTVFMTPSESNDFRQALSGELEGIGAELAIRNGAITIVAPLKGSPAEREGLQPQDIIVEVDGENIEGMSLNDVVHRIRGKQGTRVRLLIERSQSAEPISFTIVRDKIIVPSVEWEVKANKGDSIGYVSINQFGSETVPETIEALQALQKDEQRLKGLILDVRFNGGGYLEGAVEICSLLLKEGKVVSVERRDVAPERYYVSGRPVFPALPLVVLINEGSASASEIVAGALQDHRRATIIGEKSFGKGTVQEVLDLPGGSSLRVTTARWLTPAGKDLGKEGVTPDIVIGRTPEQIMAEQDPQLDTALEFLHSGTAPQSASGSDAL